MRQPLRELRARISPPSAAEPPALTPSTACSSSQAVMLFFPTAQYCICGSNGVMNNALDCSTPPFAFYFHPFGPQASGYSKRRQLAAVRRIAERETSLCPAGRAACRIEGSATRCAARRQSAVP